MYNPNVAPQNQEEFDQLIAYRVNEANTEYNNKVEEAKTNAISQWNKIINSKREELVKDGSLTEEEVNNQLNKEKEEYIQQSISMIEQPKTEKDFIEMYSFFKTWNNNDNQQPELDIDPITNSIINLDGRYYSVGIGDFIESDEIQPNQSILTIGSEPTLENLKKFITYEHSVNPDVPEMTEEVIIKEKFHMLRQVRDSKIAETDYLMNPDYPISDSYKEAIIAYRTELRDIPSLPGAPWDGGGEETPWPIKPVKS